MTRNSHLKPLPVQHDIIARRHRTGSAKVTQEVWADSTASAKALLRGLDRLRSAPLHGLRDARGERDPKIAEEHRAPPPLGYDGRVRGVCSRSAPAPRTVKFGGPLFAAIAAGRVETRQRGFASSPGLCGCVLQVLRDF